MTRCRLCVLGAFVEDSQHVNVGTQNVRAEKIFVNLVSPSTTVDDILRKVGH